MDDHALGVLEYPRVLEMVAGGAHWPPGRDAVLSLRPAASAREARERLAEVAEARRLLDQAGTVGAGGLEDIREPLRRAARGITLAPEELLAVAAAAEASRRTGRYLRDRARDYPRLAARAARLAAFPRLEREIRRCLGADGRVLDEASRKLKHLREEIAALHGRLQEVLHRLIRRPELARMLQDPLVTRRRGRYVVPVRAECRGQFPGLVIDQSGSGATLFMEPFAAVDPGNRLRSAILAEEKEVERILARLSRFVAHEAAALEAACRELGHLDGLAARVAFARDFQAVLPEINEEGVVRLEDAYHPLLVRILGRDRVVPITLEVGREAHTLVLTGPNTGGKTVTLKTLGLLACMALAGIPIPAGEGSSVSFLEGVWADIGDEQSIAGSLSTFSSHMSRILPILPRAGPRTLVLLDELGAGTDPSEGGALGMALLEHLHARGARTVVTTHLSELKAFAARTPGMENAAVEFDPETLQPTFRILMGLPGRSNALRIAHRLGLPEELLRRARELLGGEHRAVEGLLDDLEQEREAARRAGERLRDEQGEAQRMRAELSERLARLEEERRELLGEAARRAEGIVAETRRRSQALLQELRRRLAALAQLRRQELERARHTARELAEALSAGDPAALLALSQEAAAPLAEALGQLAGSAEEQPAPAVTDAAGGEPDPLDQEARIQARTVEAGLEELEQALEEIRPPRPRRQEKPVEVAPGDWVYVPRFGQEGRVLSVDGTRAEVQVGAIRISLAAGEVVPGQPPAGEPPALPESRPALVSPRVHLRGMTVDEALYELDRRLDEASLAGLSRLEVVHGKGTGRLRRAVASFLEGHACVAGFRLGDAHEGGWGVTVVELK